ncbi:MAG: ATP-binding cassette domain-containing protein [Oscillospiraceae bacterium]|jgi:branched-chain amino acid transport system ATP-binding protein|nr:ATP-binding cassette domain-containing protein [Oscillospiraceae bacterium]
MAQKNNSVNKPAMRRFVKKRDKAYDSLIFNEKYPDVACALIDQKNLRLLKQRELKMKKRLLPLEIAALPASDKNEVLFARELEAFKKSQDLPRRAVEQTHQRKIKKAGELAAKQYRDGAVARLDAALAAKTEELRQKYPGGVGSAVDKDALARYQQAEMEETTALESFMAKQAADKKRRLDSINARIAAQKPRLDEAFNTANEKLRASAVLDEASFGKDNILSIRGLKMYFSGIKAVDDLSFNIKKGEIFGLIGPNGAGKTTVFNCVTQFYKPTGGEVYYRDRYGGVVSLTDYKTPEIVKVGISRTFQNLELVYWLSILDNLLVGAHGFYRANLADQFLHTGRLKREEEVFRNRAIQLLDRLGILAYKDVPPFGLPYGVLKKVELARTLMSLPRMIILDEPAAGLNDAETEDLAEIIRVIRDDFNCTIFLVEHDMNLVMAVCDTVCTISFGKMLAMGSPEEIQNSKVVQEAYLGTE